MTVTLTRKRVALMHTTDAVAFRDAVRAAASSHKYGACVEVKSPAEYREMFTMMTPCECAGFAVTDEGEIVSVFSRRCYEIHEPVTCGELLEEAIFEGGTRLDCFDTVLPELYARHGFREVARLTWDDQYAPKDWDYGTYARWNNGRPDVVLMSL